MTKAALALRFLSSCFDIATNKFVGFHFSAAACSDREFYAAPQSSGQHPIDMSDHQFR
jgi:predicted nucleic-acid-binding Zn-ribbon protein